MDRHSRELRDRGDIAESLEMGTLMEAPSVAAVTRTSGTSETVGIWLLNGHGTTEVALLVLLGPGDQDK